MSYNNIGYIYFEQKNYDLAISYYSQAIKVYPKYFNAFRNRADAKIAKGDKEGACKDLQTAADLGDEKSLQSFKEYCNKK